MFHHYKTVIWVASLMSCWLLWQPVAMFAYYLCTVKYFCSMQIND